MGQDKKEKNSTSVFQPTFKGLSQTWAPDTLASQVSAQFYTRDFLSQQDLYLQEASQPSRVRQAAPVLIALSLGLIGTQSAFASTAVNTVNTGQTIEAGTYYNTPGSKTTFTNTQPAGLWLHSGDTVRGLESNANGVPDGNGGSVYLNAPGSVVRIDGTIDVSGIKNGTFYTGNGGSVVVNSAYIYQTGNIYANGVNGGMVQFNVGSATLTAGAQITAMGYGGAGGKVSINASDMVNIGAGAIIDTSGKVISTYDTNVIDIEGGLVNNEGIIRANGVAGTDPHDASGDVVLIQENPSLASIAAPTSTVTGSAGGTIDIVANGQNNTVCTDCAIENVDNNLLATQPSPALFTPTEQAALVQEHDSLVAQYNGDIVNSGTIQANGSNGVYVPCVPCSATGKDGGSIILSAENNVDNTSTGIVQANGGNAASVPGMDGLNGGNGGTIAVNAMNASNNDGLYQANGGNGSDVTGTFSQTALSEPCHCTPADANATATGFTGGNGGDGGLITFSYQTMSNSSTGTVQANGGIGGAGQDASAEATAISTMNPVASAYATAQGGQGGTGGQGGLIAFSGPANPTGGGLVEANGGQGGVGGDASATTSAHSTDTSGVTTNSVADAITNNGGTGGGEGTVVTVAPGTFATSQNYQALAGGQGDSGHATASAKFDTPSAGVHQANSSTFTSGDVTTGSNNTLQQIHQNDLLVNGPNAILLSDISGPGNAETTLSGRLGDAIVRTVVDPTGVANANAQATFLTASNTVVASTTGNSLVIDFNSFNSNQTSVLNTQTVVNDGSITNTASQFVGLQYIGGNPNQIYAAQGGGHLDWLANGDITNSGSIISVGQTSGGSIGLAAQGNLDNSGVIANLPMNDNAAQTLLGNPPANPTFTFSDGGSIILKSTGDMTNEGSINNYQVFGPALGFSSSFGTPAFLNNAQVGSTIQMFAGGNMTNSGTISADAYTYRNGDNATNSPADAYGGTLISFAGDNNVNTGTITADARSFVDPNGLQYENGTATETTATGGYIRFQGGNTASNGTPTNSTATIEANGSTAGGEVLITAYGNPQGGLNEGQVSGSTFTNGIGTGTTTNGIDTTIGQSAFNFGQVSTQSYTTGGQSGSILIAGDGQVGLGASSKTEGNLLLASENGVVEAILCNVPLPPAVPPGSPLTPPYVPPTETPTSNPFSTIAQAPVLPVANNFLNLATPRLPGDPGVLASDPGTPLREEKVLVKRPKKREMQTKVRGFW